MCYAKDKKTNTVPVAETTTAPTQEPNPSAKKQTAKITAEKKVLIQYGGNEWSVADLEEKVIAAYVAAGHRRGRITKLDIYIKPEERKIYYAINDKATGSADFE